MHGRETEKLGPGLAIEHPTKLNFDVKRTKKLKDMSLYPTPNHSCCSNGGLLYKQGLNCDDVAITDLTYGRHSKVKQPRHVIAEDKRLHDISKDRFLAWQRLNVLRIKDEECGTR